jgi:osmoprotectant transport system substrate-binding protein
VVAPALAGGLIEFLPEYTGTALRFSSLGDVEPADDLATAAAQLAAALADADVTVLEPAPAEDANAFVVTRETAARLGLERLSDLAPVAADLVFGGPAACPSRPLCLAGLRRVYGIRFADVVELDAGGPMTKQALRSNAVDVALLFTSDPALGDGRYVALDDDRALQPAENIVPLVRSELNHAWRSRHPAPSACGRG